MKRSKRGENKTNLLIEILGWCSVIAILGAYTLLSFNFLLSSSLIYQLLNITGAIGLIIEAYSKKDYEPVILNIIWFLIALISILRILF